MRARYPKRPSQRDVRNLLAFAAGSTVMEAPTTVKRGPQAENDTHKEVAAWRNTKPSLVLERNKRRLAIPMGYDKPIMLGWMMDGSADWIGWESVTVTPNMVGRKVAVFVGLESKRRKSKGQSGGTTSEAQDEFLARLKDDGGIVGVVRCFEDCDLARERWIAKVGSDER